MERRAHKCRKDECDKMFTSLKGRLCHEQGPEHNKIPQHECPCGKKYYSNKSLKRHVTVTHKKLRHYCESPWPCLSHHSDITFISSMRP